MPKKPHILIIVLVLIVFGAWCVSRFHTKAVTPTPQQTSVLDRVQKSGVLRCGYVSFDPYLKKDPNTGKITGVTVDYLEQTAARQGLKIDWAQEINIDQVFEAIDYDHIDMFCLPCSPIPAWTARVDFVGSFGKLPYYIYVPYKSKKTIDDLQTAHFSAVDGYIPTVETPRYFPNATLTGLPQTASMAELYDQLKYEKVDAIINEHVSALNYIRNNPETIRRLNDTPLFTKTMSFPIKKGDVRWGEFVQRMTDTTLPENQALFRALNEQYGLTGNALLY